MVHDASAVVMFVGGVGCLVSMTLMSNSEISIIIVSFFLLFDVTQLLRGSVEFLNLLVLSCSFRINILFTDFIYHEFVVLLPHTK